MSDDNQRIAVLIWGVKESFRRYVEATGGVIEASDGAERGADGAFRFAATPDSSLRLAATGGGGTGIFRGEVRFEAHGGMLSVRLADPILEVGPTGAVLSMIDRQAGDLRVEIARLDLTAATTNGEDGIALPAALTSGGSQVLGDHYPPTTALDPVRLHPG